MGRGSNSSARQNPLRKLASGTDRRLVNDEAELMQVVEAALARIQSLLLGERPMAQHLWNVVRDPNTKATIRTPKDENTFSDFVASLLPRSEWSRHRGQPRG